MRVTKSARAFSHPFPLTLKLFCFKMQRPGDVRRFSNRGRDEGGQQVPGRPADLRHLDQSQPFLSSGDLGRSSLRKSYEEGHLKEFRSSAGSACDPFKDL